MTDVIVILLILSVVAAAVYYIVKAKKKGQCIGCPNSGGCSGGCHCADQDTGHKTDSE